MIAQDKNDFGIWTSIEGEKKIIKNLNVAAEGEFRTRDNSSEVDRWAGSLNLSYRLLPYLKAGVGYTYIYSNQAERITGKGNIVSSYWGQRHRLNATLSGNYKWQRFNFSLRERWQYTYRPEQSVSKFASDGTTPKEDEIVKAKNKHVLRSRLQVAYDIKKSKFTPYVSCELYHALYDAGESGFEKTRLTAGTTYKLNKKNSFDIYYRFQTKSDEDEPNGHILGLGYSHKF